MKPTSLISLWLIACVALFASGDKCEDFGKGIKPFAKAKSQTGVVDFSGDYNGDGIIDRLVFMRLPKRPAFAKDVNVVYMLGDSNKPEYRASLGIAFILSDKTSAECKKYIIYNEGFFDFGAGEFSMWDNPLELPFYLIKKDNKGYVKQYYDEMDYFEWKEQTPDLATDAIVVISHSIAGILIYWKDQTFHAEWEKDFDP